ncbi:unnamed protein product [Darwinula stevensoni]|uniref:Uncharacterized protein n=1 Tax=Darwinula stevensoni TaxID=69355 RepID=A0A7R9ABP2_9CRUS|nr:unnamed protein product [Darwinula stevensoni]CAG0899616.1 unnamed protein product [Darwinula stevensoni]
MGMQEPMFASAELLETLEKISYKRTLHINVAQEKRRTQFASRKSKGVKSFRFREGDEVLFRNLKDGCKDGRMEDDWSSPYVMVEVRAEGQMLWLHQHPVPQMLRLQVRHLIQRDAPALSPPPCAEDCPASPSEPHLPPGPMGYASNV